MREECAEVVEKERFKEAYDYGVETCDQQRKTKTDTTPSHFQQY
jgi:hypothetical protein